MSEFMPRYKTILLLPLLFLPLCLFSQSKVIRDLRFRASVKAEKEIVNDLDAFIESEIVMEQDISAMGKVFAEAGLEYSPFKNLSLEGKYRFSKNRKSTSGEFKYTHMVALAAQYDHKIERFKLYYRNDTELVSYLPYMFHTFGVAFSFDL
ncbi:MAG: hypothetical protein K9H26_11630 [Prolixibacteraceae bacterium]|nr:hypothetical protein [Prolixibacteraceae bacterium]